MNAIAAHLEKLKDYIFILLVTGLYTVVANTFGYNGDLAQGAVGILVIVAIAFFGVVIQMLPGFNKLPVVFWVSLTAVIVSIPSFPGGVWIVEQTKHIDPDPRLRRPVPGQGPRGLQAPLLAHRPRRHGRRLGQLPLRHRARRADAAPRGHLLILVPTIVLQWTAMPAAPAGAGAPGPVNHQI